MIKSDFTIGKDLQVSRARCPRAQAEYHFASRIFPSVVAAIAPGPSHCNFAQLSGRGLLLSLTCGPFMPVLQRAWRHRLRQWLQVKLSVLLSGGGRIVDAATLLLAVARKLVLLMVRYHLERTEPLHFLLASSSSNQLSLVALMGAFARPSGPGAAIPDIASTASLRSPLPRTLWRSEHLDSHESTASKPSFF